MIVSNYPAFQNGKHYIGWSEDGTVHITHPSAKHPGFWWWCRITHGIAEGLRRPIDPKAIPHFFPTEPTIRWKESQWDGSEMTMHLEGGGKIKQPRTIYIVEAIGLNCVKIGISTGTAGLRIETLQVGCPVKLELLVCFPGTPKTEASLHRRFEKEKIHGEWFTLTSSLRSFIASKK